MNSCKSARRGFAGTPSVVEVAGAFILPYRGERWKSGCSEKWGGRRGKFKADRHVYYCIIVRFYEMLSFLKSLFGGTPDQSLDNDLAAKILDNLKIEPSEQLRDMFNQSAATGKWSPEALHAARVLLDQRANKLAPEPIYRTVPRAELVLSSRNQERVAPGISRQLLALDVGSPVYCRWRGETGIIIRWHDEVERFYIRYANGEGEWATLSMFG